MSCSLLTVSSIGQIQPDTNRHRSLGNSAAMIQSRAGIGQGMDPKAKRPRTIIHINEKVPRIFVFFFFLRFGNKWHRQGSSPLSYSGKGNRGYGLKDPDIVKLFVHCTCRFLSGRRGNHFYFVEQTTSRVYDLVRHEPLAHLTQQSHQTLLRTQQMLFEPVITSYWFPPSVLMM